MSAPRRPTTPRGFSLLLALGMVAAFTVAALLSLAYVSQSNEVQGQARRTKEAFFAAEAGLAEAKERLRILRGASPDYNSVMTALGQYPTANADHPQPVGPQNEWYEVIPPTNYGLTRTSAVAPAAIDDGVAGANRELNGPTGAAFTDFPNQANVRFRVFMRDDFDDGVGVQNQAADANQRVWLVSIGTVQLATGRPVQAVVTALVENQASSSGRMSGTSQRMTSLTSTEGGLPGAGAINVN